MHAVMMNDHDQNISGDDNSSTRNPHLETYFMKQALHVAKEALDIGEVPVGCVVVLNDASSLIEQSAHEKKEHCATNEEEEASSSSNALSYHYTSQQPVIISHGANQVNATRDATRHAEIVAIDRMLTSGRSSDQMKLSEDVICKSAHGKVPSAYTNSNPSSSCSSEGVTKNKIMNDSWINVPSCKGHWKNSFGWGSGRVYNKEILSKCDLYVTCEPCIMVREVLNKRIMLCILRLILYTSLMPLIIFDTAIYSPHFSPLLL